MTDFLTLQYLFDYNAERSDVFAALCDIAWAGNFHYSVYGSLCNGGTSVLFAPTKYHPGAGEPCSISQYIPCGLSQNFT